MTRKPKIILEIQGGLGNQLFQLSAAISLRGKSNRLIEVNKRSYLDPRMRSYSLGEFENVFNFKSRTYVPRLGRSIEFNEEEEFSYKPPLVNSDSTIRVKGYFQNPMYISAASPEVEEGLLEVAIKVKQIEKCKCPKEHVAIHIRRGDYVSIPVNLSTFGVLTDSYFLRNIQMFTPRKTHFTIFSDSSIVAAKVIETLPDYQIDFFNHKISDLETLISLSSFSTMIISNSSFSWWAAHISQVRNSRVDILSPKKWFKEFPKSDILINRNWTLLDPEWY